MRPRNQRSPRDREGVDHDVEQHHDDAGEQADPPATGRPARTHRASRTPHRRGTETTASRRTARWPGRARCPASPRVVVEAEGNARRASRRTRPRRPPRSPRPESPACAARPRSRAAAQASGEEAEHVGPEQRGCPERVEAGAWPGRRGRHRRRWLAGVLLDQQRFSRTGRARVMPARDCYLAMSFWVGCDDVSRGMTLVDGCATRTPCALTPPSSGHRLRSSPAQAPDGHWVGELEANTTITSEYLLFCHLTDRVDRERERKIVAYLRRRAARRRRLQHLRGRARQPVGDHQGLLRDEGRRRAGRRPRDGGGPRA